MTTERPVVPRWDLQPLGPDLGSPQYRARQEELAADLTRLGALFDELDVRDGPTLDAGPGLADQAARVLDALDHTTAGIRSIRAQAYGWVTEDATNSAAAATQEQLRAELTVPLNQLTTRFDAWAARLDIDALAGMNPTVADHAYPLARRADAAAHQMSEAEEALAGELGLTGGAAWTRLHAELSARLVGRPTHGPDAGEELPMTVLRATATDPDPDRRAAAFEAELAGWESLAVPFAAALNAQKGETIALNRRRGWADDLEPSLEDNGIDRPTLDAMTEAVVAALPEFRRFLRVKAGLLGHGHTMPWSGLVAPVSEAATGFDWSDALARVRSAFSSFGPELDRLAARAIDEDWIDAQPRAGKAGGAFCLPVEGEVSRILMTFDGSADAIQTLAHELGHAYHNHNLGQRSWLQRHTPRCLAETASIFCETLVVESLLADPSTDRLAVLDTDLSGATQVVVDIHSRYLFESELYRRRRHGIVSVEELCELMLDCQRQAYGDGVEPLHPYMWAVKAHYFTPFYNFPYTFGLLFGLGLYAAYERDPEVFRSHYDSLLGATGLASAAELALRFDIDLTDRAFWDSSLGVLGRRIDEYCELAAQLD